MKAMVWKYGFRVWFGRHSVALLGPRDARLFSERNGYRKPLVRVGPWRVFVDTSNSAICLKPGKRGRNDLH